MKKLVYVYSGEGASQRSILSSIESLKACLHSVQVRQLNAVDLLDGYWQENCVLLVIPGGMDLPYCEILNGRGNNFIKEFVNNGGAYLGICAGAYYACRRIEFEVGNALEITGDRELAFFPGTGKGAVQPGFDYSCEVGSAALAIKFQDVKAENDWQRCCDYANGGPSFVSDADIAEFSVDIIAKYEREDIEGAAAVKCKVGAGVAVLCGTHPELRPKWLDKPCQVDWMSRAHPQKDAGEVLHLVANTKSVKYALSEHQNTREHFMKNLLVAAGLDQYIRWASISNNLHKISPDNSEPGSHSS